MIYLYNFYFSLTRSAAPSAPPSRPEPPISANRATDKQSPAPRKARALYDYDAGDATELSLLADEVFSMSLIINLVIFYHLSL